MKSGNVVMIASVFLALSYAAEASTPDFGRNVFRPAAVGAGLTGINDGPAQGPLGGLQVASSKICRASPRRARRLRTNTTRVQRDRL